MSHLTRYLQQQLNAQIASARKNLTAHGPRISQAETLANKLQSQAVEALAAGRIDGHHVLIWVAVTATYQTILAGIQYNNSSDTPDTTPRTVTVAVNDGTDASASHDVTVNVAAELVAVPAEFVATQV